MIDLFWDEEAQGFFDTGRDHETLITRPRDLFDNATPAGSSVAADVLLRLALSRDRPDFEERALTCLRAIAPCMSTAPTTAFGRSLAALDFHVSTPQELAIVWPEAQSPDAAKPFVDLVRSTYAPNLLLIGGAAGQVTTRRCCSTTARPCRARQPPTCVRNTSARRRLRTLPSWQPNCRRFCVRLASTRRELCARAHAAPG